MTKKLPKNFYVRVFQKNFVRLVRMISKSCRKSMWKIVRFVLSFMSGLKMEVKVLKALCKQEDL